MQFSRDTNNLIAALRGLPADRGRSRARPAFPMAALIEVLEERYQLGRERLESVIARHWKDIVGEHAAHRSSPQRIVAGSILLIHVSNPVLRQEMAFQQKHYLAHLHRLPGGAAIQALSFRAG